MRVSFHSLLILYYNYIKKKGCIQRWILSGKLRKSIHISTTLVCSHIYTPTSQDAHTPTQSLTQAENTSQVIPSKKMKVATHLNSSEEDKNENQAKRKVVARSPKKDKRRTSYILYQREREREREKKKRRRSERSISHAKQQPYVTLLSNINTYLPFLVLTPLH